MAKRRLSWFKVQLCNCNTGPMNGLMIPTADVEKCIFPFFADNEKEAAIKSGIPFRLIDINKATENTFSLKLWPTLSSYVLADGWEEFVKRKGFMAGDVLTFWRDEIGGQFKLWITGLEWFSV